MDVDTRKKLFWNAVSQKKLNEATSRSPEVFSNASKISRAAGVSRRLVLISVGAFARFFTSVLNRTKVHNFETLLDLVQSRPRGTPLITVSNHMSTLDDPLMWGLKGLPITDPKLSRWTLTAEDICFTNPVFSYFFRLGKCIPVRRGAGIYQPYMDEALDVINGGDWLHTFPEGKLSQEEGPMKRLKWGVASLIDRAAKKPIVLPIAHSGFEKVLPENFLLGRRPLLPLCMKHISIVVGEPIIFDLARLKLTAKAMTSESSSRPFSACSNSGSLLSWGGSESSAVSFPPDGINAKEELVDESSVILDEGARRWMYSHMSENIRCVLQDLALKAKLLNRSHGQ